MRTNIAIFQCDADGCGKTVHVENMSRDAEERPPPPWVRFYVSFDPGRMTIYADACCPECVQAAAAGCVLRAQATYSVERLAPSEELPDGAQAYIEMLAKAASSPLVPLARSMVRTRK